MMSGPDSSGLYTMLDSASKCFHAHDPEGIEPAYGDRFDDIGAFFFGFAVAKLDGAHFHIRTDGSRAYPETFTGTVAAFDPNGRALVCTTEKRFYVVAEKPGGPIHEEPYTGTHAVRWTAL